MAKNPNRTYKVKVAAPAKKVKFNLPKTHICTSDFGVLKSIDCRLYVPGDDFNFKISQFTRLMPMPVPTYGDIKSITRCFVVPINTVMTNFGEFISKNFSMGEAASSSSVLYNPAVPFFNTKNIVHLFFDGDNENTYQPNDFSVDADYLGNDPSSVRYDAVVLVSDGFLGINFTNLGRKVVSWLNGLGLNWSWSVRDRENQKISALPVLCWWKFYLDWIVPSRYRNEFAEVLNVLGCSYNTSNCDLFSVIYGDNYDDFKKLFVPVSCYYSDDYFNNAFISPYGLEQSSPSGSFDYNRSGQFIEAADGSYPSATVDFNGHYAPELDVSSGYDSSSFNYFSLQSLCILQDMVNAGKLAGTKVQDYLLTTYGIRPNDDVLHISKYIGSQRNTIQIGDIKATATTNYTSGGNTNTSYLGQFAGTAAGGNVDTFEFGNYDEHCYIFITNELSIRPSYTQGNHVEFTALDRYDFYDPHFDGVGVTAIPFKELCSSFDYSDGTDAIDVPQPDSVFGYRPTYAEHKTSFDIISGDFRCGTLNTGLDSWFMNRQINKKYLDVVGTYINRKFSEQISDADNYDRIFQIANNNSDHFYSVFQIDCTAYRHMISLVDALETDSKDDGEGHKDVNVDFQGTVNS